MKNNRQWVESIKAQYPAGIRIRLVSMDDPYAPVPSGTEGEVMGVDDIGTLLMKWSNGRSLGVVVGEDSFTVISRPQQLEAQDEPVQDDGGMSMKMR